MKKAFLLFVLLISAATMGWGQVNITPTMTGLMTSFSSWTFTSCDQRNASGNDYITLLSSTSLVKTPVMNFTNYSSMTLDFKARTYGGPNTAQATITISISTNNGSSWTSLGTKVPTTTTLTAMGPINISSYSGTQVFIKLETLGASLSKGVGIDDIDIKGVFTGNSITTGTVSTPPFCITSSSTASGTVAYTSTGTYTSATFTAYLSDANGGFTSPTSIGTTSVTGTNPSGSLNITIPANKTSGTGYKIRIDCEDPAVTGSTSTAFEIVNGANNVSGQSASTQSGQSVISWTNPTGCYDEIMIVGKAGSAVTASPSGDGSDYPLPNLTFGSGTGFDGGYVLYKGSTSGQTVTNLTNGTTYYFTFFTRKSTSWSSGVTTNVIPAQSSSSTDYFRSKVTGNWSEINTWESSPDGNDPWISATLTPTSAANAITIKSGKIVTVDASISVDQLVIDASGQLTINSSSTLTIADGTGTDLSVSGTLTNQGTLTMTGTASFESGSLYKHDRNGGSLPVNTTWNSSSTIEISGTTSTIPTFSSSVNYGNVTWNCASQGSSTLNLQGTLTNIAGNFTVTNTNGYILRLAGGANVTVSIGGDFIMNGSSVSLQFANNSSSTYTYVLNIGGSWNQTAGTFNANTGSNNNLTVNFIGLNKTFTQSGGTLTNALIEWNINNGASLSLSSNLPVAASRTMTVNGTLDCGSTYTVSGSGLFSLASGAILKVGHSSGINGSIAVTGTKTLNGAANYVFDGMGAQVTGALLPSTVQSLTLAGTSDLSVSNSGLLTVSGGMTIGSGTKFTIGSAQSLTVGGTLTNNGNASSLVIKSDATGTGSLITSSSPLATVERYLTNYTTTTDHKYHMISSPVTLQAIRPMFVANAPSPYDDFYKYDETATSNPWINTKDGDGNWNTAFESEFVVGRGYLVSYKDIPVSPRSFSGTLNSYSSGSPLVITCTYTEAGGKGWNLIGNPFSSALDWNLVTPSLGSGMENALYYYDASTENYLYYIDINEGIGTGSRYIPAMQGFMVHAKSSGTHTVTLNDGMRAHSSQNFYKSAESLPGSLSLTVSSGGYEDAAFVYFHEGATTAFDGSYDAYKLSSYSTEVPAIYTISSDNKNVAINGLPELTEDLQIPVWFKAGKVGTYTLNADIANMPATVFLKDLETGTDQNLRVNPEYTFTAGDLEASGRFLLHFSALGVDNGGNADNLNIYTSGNGIFITSGGNVPVSGDIFVYNLLGQQILHQRMAEGSLSKIAVNGPSGYYLVKVVTGQKSFTGKVFIR